ncbi:MAG: glycosyltransferase N-terminal domain-containing protein [Desulfosalsimonadaceae bacterium]
MTDKPLHTAFQVYEKGWALAMPLLRLSRRLQDGFAHRKLETSLPYADLWIQAASGGEAYLAWTLLEHLRTTAPLRVLVTTNTRQGMDIIGKAAAALARINPALTLFPAWFPFDRPSTMAAAVSQVNPKLAVLLESEMWPGFMHALKSRKCPVLIINGRMTKKSMSAYRRFPGTCKALRPDRILAISREDAHRFETVFGQGTAGVMNNIKFDSLAVDLSDKNCENPTGFMAHLIPAGARFLVLGSIRREEEANIAQIIQKTNRARPDVITGLFPRHLERVEHWKKALSGLGLRWRLRSGIEKPVQGGDIILWDVFGELAGAYAAADAVFVGGSLAPLGGQNFLEPLACGTVPVIGPSHENFSWVGEEIFRSGLVIKTRDSDEAADAIIRQLKDPLPHPEIASKAMAYITARQGGARRACEVIEKILGDEKNAA